jgi:hypothetical protein
MRLVDKSPRILNAIELDRDRMRVVVGILIIGQNIQLKRSDVSDADASRENGSSQQLDAGKPRLSYMTEMTANLRLESTTLLHISHVNLFPPVSHQSR